MYRLCQDRSQDSGVTFPNGVLLQKLPFTADTCNTRINSFQNNHSSVILSKGPPRRTLLSPQHLALTLSPTLTHTQATRSKDSFTHSSLVPSRTAKETDNERLVCCTQPLSHSLTHSQHRPVTSNHWKVGGSCFLGVTFLEWCEWRQSQRIETRLSMRTCWDHGL